ncbi:MAG: CvpA family protein [Rikenellaceae bacterium]
MNIIDLIVLIVLAIAAFSGWRQGLIVQVCSLVAIFVGIWFAKIYGSAVGEMLCMSSDYAPIGGFIIVLVLVVIAAAILSRIIKNLFSFVGLGIIDTLLGVALSVCKYALILSLLFNAFGGINKELKIVSQTTLDNSTLYQPMVDVSGKIFPALDWTKKQINSGLEKL